MVAGMVEVASMGAAPMAVDSTAEDSTEEDSIIKDFIGITAMAGIIKAVGVGAALAYPLVLLTRPAIVTLILMDTLTMAIPITSRIRLTLIILTTLMVGRDNI
jgi:hypothetical protein